MDRVSPPFKAEVVDLTSPTTRRHQRNSTHSHHHHHHNHSNSSSSADGLGASLPCVAHRVYTYHSNCGCHADDVATAASQHRLMPSSPRKSLIEDQSASLISPRSAHMYTWGSASGRRKRNSFDGGMPKDGTSSPLFQAVDRKASGDPDYLKTSLDFSAVTGLTVAGDTVCAGLSSGEVSFIHMVEGSRRFEGRAHPDHVGGVTCVTRATTVGLFGPTPLGSDKCYPHPLLSPSTVITGGADGKVLVWIDYNRPDQRADAFVIHQFTTPVRRIEAVLVSSDNNNIITNSTMVSGDNTPMHMPMPALLLAASSDDELAVYMVRSADLTSGTVTPSNVHPDVFLLVLEQERFSNISLSGNLIAAAYRDRLGLSAWSIAHHTPGARWPSGVRATKLELPIVNSLSSECLRSSSGLECIGIGRTSSAAAVDGRNAQQCRVNSSQSIDDGMRPSLYDACVEANRPAAFWPSLKPTAVEVEAPFGEHEESDNPTCSLLAVRGLEGRAETFPDSRQRVEEKNKDTLAVGSKQVAKQNEVKGDGALVTDGLRVPAAHTSVRERTKTDDVLLQKRAAEPSERSVNEGPPQLNLTVEPVYHLPPEQSDHNESSKTFSSSNLNVLSPTRASPIAIGNALTQTRSAANMKSQVDTLRREIDMLTSTLAKLRRDATDREDAHVKDAEAQAFKYLMLQKENEYLREELMETNPVAGERLLIWDLHNKGGTLDKKDSDIADLTAALAQQARELTEAKAQLKETTAFNANLEQELRTALEDRDHYKRQLDEADTSENNAMKALTSLHEGSLSTARQENESLRAQISFLEGQVGSLSAELDSKRWRRSPHACTSRAVQTSETYLPNIPVVSVSSRPRPPVTTLVSPSKHQSYSEMRRNTKGDWDSEPTSPTRRNNSSYSQSPYASRRTPSKARIGCTHRHDPNDLLHLNSCLWCSGKTFMHIGGTFGVNETRSPRFVPEHPEGSFSHSPSRIVSFMAVEEGLS